MVNRIGGSGGLRVIPRPLRTVRLEGCIWVTADCDLGFMAAVQAGEFTRIVVDKNFHEELLPPRASGYQELKVNFHKLPEGNTSGTAEEWLAAFQETGERFIHPRFLLALRDKNHKLDPTCHDLIFTLWPGSNSQVWAAVLDEDLKQRALGIHLFEPGHEFRGDRYRAAVNCLAPQPLLVDC